MSDIDPRFPRDPGLSWSQLRAFMACARHRSFKAAATAVGLTAAAVRYQIGLLEHRLGGRLFERRGGTLALTDAGVLFARRIETPMRDLMTACATVSASVDDAEMTLTAPPLFARQFLFGKPFLKWCETNRINLDVSDVKRDLFSQQPLAAIRLAAAEHPGLSSTPLLNVSAIIAAAPSIAKNARPASENWWADQVLINTSVSTTGWLRVWKALGLTLPKVPRTHFFSSYAAALEAASSGFGIILAALPFANVELDAGRLVRVSSVQISSNQRYSLLMQKGPALSPRGRALHQRLVAMTARVASSVRRS